MKTIIKITVSILVIIIAAFWLKIWYFNWKNKNEKELVGTYILDTMQTDLKNFEKKGIKYDKMMLYLDKDKSFRFNMSVPFVYDSIGMWSAAGSNIEEWHNLYFQGTRSIMAQFDQTTDRDTTIIFNNMQAKAGFKNIQHIFFKKLKSIHQR